MSCKHSISIVAAMLLAATTGCAGGLGLFPSTAARSPAPSLSGGGPVGVGQQPPPKTFSQRVASGFQSIGTALTPTARVIKAKDPISLEVDTKPNSSLFVAAARASEQSGDFDGAAEQYQRALKLDANNLGALVGMARLYDRAGEFAKANSTYQEALRAHPGNPLATNDLGLCLARQGKFAESADLLRRAVEAQPDNPRYRNNLGTVLVEMGQTDAAVEQFSAVHGPAIGHYNVAVLLQQNGDAAGARRHAELALQAKPSLTPAQQLLARLPATRPAGPPAAPAAARPPRAETPRIVPAVQNRPYSPPPSGGGDFRVEEEPSVRLPQVGPYRAAPGDLEEAPLPDIYPAGPSGGPRPLPRVESTGGAFPY